MKRGDRVGVLMASESGGTCLAPAIVLRSDDRYTEVWVRKDSLGGAISTHSTITEYVEPPFTAETFEAWQPHWEAIEAYINEYEKEAR